MAEAPTPIFNKRATAKLRSPDDLEKFVRVTNPSVWVALAACIALFAGLLAWGVFGAVTTNVTATGAVVTSADGTRVPLCLLSAEDAAKVHVDDAALVGGKRMKVSRVAPVPMSVDEAKQLLQSDYLVSALIKADWGYAVYFDGDASELSLNVPITVNITVERVAPISLILKNWG